MAQFLVRQAHGGETRTVTDGALPFFLSQGWVIVDTLDDSADVSPLYLSRAESDLRYVQTAEISDPASSDGAELRTFFEEKVDRTGAVTGQVPVLQSDGKLKFAAGGSGGGAGTVTSVNGKTPDGTGAVTLSPGDGLTGDATAAAKGLVQLAGDLAGTAAAPTVPNSIRTLYNWTNTDPVRPNTTAKVLWITPDTDRPGTNGTTAGGTYAAAEGDLGGFFT